MAYSPYSTQGWQGLGFSYDQIFYDELNPTDYQHTCGCYLCSSNKTTEQKLVAKRCEILGYMDSIIMQAKAKSWKPREYRVSNPYYECVIGLTTHYLTFPIIYDASVPFEVIRLIWD